MAAAPQRSAHILIHGRVQGVGFRWWLAGEAQSLDVGGWVKNRADGTVEVKMSGATDAVSELLKRCTIGPPGAQVRHFDLLGEELETFADFRIIRGGY